MWQVRIGFKKIFLSLLIGLTSGLATSAFIFSLQWLTEFRESHSSLYFFLPLGGLIIGLMYFFIGKESSKGTGLILDEIHNPKNVLPWMMAPLVFLGTLITHLFGGSAGREGTAVQVSSALADRWAQYFKIEKQDRKFFLVAGAGAGFSAAIGAPLAGALFGLEVIQVGRLKLFAWVECLIASFTAYFVCVFLKVPHLVLPGITNIDYSFKLILAIVFSGICFGVLAKRFLQLTRLIENQFHQRVRPSYLRPLLGGCLLVLLFKIEGTTRFMGLGLPVIQTSFLEVHGLNYPLLKGFFTALTVGSGFKGGEFIPLVFIGTTAGSFLAYLFSVSIPVLAAVGFAAVFGAAANTPLACTVMAMEIFGYQIGPLAFCACWMAFYFSGPDSIYQNQKIFFSKKDHLVKQLNWFKKRISL